MMTALTPLLIALLVVLLSTLIFIKLIFPTKTIDRAQIEAVLRYLGTFEPDVFAKCPDNLAVHFVPHGIKSIAGASPLRFFARRVYARKLPGMYEQTLARARLWDTCVHQLVRRNHVLGKADTRIEQLVVIGGKYDTRCFRFSEMLQENNVSVIEVDQQQIVRTKRERLEMALGSLPAHIRFAETEEFSAACIAKALKQAKYDSKRVTLFQLDHVTAGLTTDAIAEIFAWIKANSPKGSIVLFDFWSKAAIDEPKKVYGAPEAMALCKKSGVAPTAQFAIDEKKLADWVGQQRFSLTQHILPTQLSRFTRKTTGARLGRISRYLNCAVVTSD